MLSAKRGKVIEIIYSDTDIVKFVASIDGTEDKCINYTMLTGPIKVGDEVLVNTTSARLKLGTGGYHFVIANLSRPETEHQEEGHIMKLRYTPMQFSVLSVEAQESAYHNVFKDFKSLEGMPVIVGSLHSMLAPCCIYLKNTRPEIKICYIMSEGGALPLFFSETVARLKQQNWLDASVTYGNCFGGDYECINIYTALITAKEIAKADIAIVCMGPGIAGTDTAYGFSGAEQAGIADAVSRLGGSAIVVPRLSFADSRARHQGISHHSLTVLSRLCCTRASVAIPLLQNGERMGKILQQLEERNINSLHNITYVDYDKFSDIYSKDYEELSTMGRDFFSDPEFFYACGASAYLALEQLTS